MSKPLTVEKEMVVHIERTSSPIVPLQNISSVVYESFALQLDGEFRWKQIDKGLESFFNCPANDLVDRPLTEAVHPQDRSHLQEMYKLATQGRLVGMELRLRAGGDKFRWARISLIPESRIPPITACHGAFLDIHECREAEAELIAREEHYRKIVEEMHEGYFETDLNGTVTFCNQALLSLSGYKHSELIGRNFRKLAVRRSVHAMQAVFGRLLKSEQDSKVSNFEVFHKAGRTIIVELHASLIRDGESAPAGFRGILRDVSEDVRSNLRERRIQNQIYQTQKMEALGTLAGGLAHGFNNVLMAIQGNLSLMRMNLTADNTMHKNLERISQSTEKGVNLAKQILSFAKMGKFVVMPTNLNTILKSTSRMFVRNKPNIRIHEYFAEDLWEAEVDRVQIGQVLLSLYVNGVEGMPNGGDLYLQSENVILDASYTEPYDLVAGRFVKISVTDSGRGLSEESRQRLFEPFFSANRPGRIEGLGMAAVYGTVKSHKGIINAYSEKGHGTTITIYLPVSRKKRSAPEIGSVARGNETILLVDDDEAALGSAKEILERSGYRAITAATGAEAINAFAQCEKKIDLVLLDVILPDMDTMKVYRQLKKIRPKILVLLASGYNRNKKIGNLLREGCVDFIQKPYQSWSLALKVRTALDVIGDAASGAEK
jgi:PAS domain S-box-containing protein